MNKLTSFYLDLLRVTAAFGVLFVHANLPLFSNALFLRAELGHKLVMVFFVLSGYLIAFTVNKKNKGSERYLVDRFSRLYSVVIPALIFTFLIDFLGSHFNPLAYTDQIAPDHKLLRFVLNAAFLQQVWSFCTKPSSNGPFWSISYEFWYYILYWVFCYFKGIKQYIGIAVVCLIIGLKIILLLPVWILGVLAYKYSDQLIIKKSLANLVFLATLLFIIVLTFVWDFSVFSDRFVFGKAPLYFSSQFVFDWVYGLLVALNLFSLKFISLKFEPPLVLENVIKYLSSVTFSIYLFHLPILIFIGAIIPYNKSSYLQTISLLFVLVIFVCLISVITEKQREHWKTLFSKMFNTASSKSSINV